MGNGCSCRRGLSLGKRMRSLRSGAGAGTAARRGRTHPSSETSGFPNGGDDSGWPKGRCLYLSVFLMSFSFLFFSFFCPFHLLLHFRFLVLVFVHVSFHAQVEIPGIEASALIE